MIHSPKYIEFFLRCVPAFMDSIQEFTIRVKLVLDEIKSSTVTETDEVSLATSKVEH